MDRTRFLLGIGGIALIAIGGALLWSAPPALAPTDAPPHIETTATITLNGVPLRVAVADTPALRQQGLSGYAPLSDDEGMLFVFDEDGYHSFWMKDMLFALDILWVDAAGRVVHVERNVAPETFPATFTPDSPARYVLEVRAGRCDVVQCDIGSEVMLPRHFRVQ